MERVMATNLLVQFSTSYEGTNPVLQYLLKVYEENGYPGNADYLEVPTWAAWVAGMLRAVGTKARMEHTHAIPQYVYFELVRNRMEVSYLCHDYGKYVVVWGSVLDANKHLWADFIRQAPETWEFNLGGYISEDDQSDLISLSNNTVWFDSVAQAANDLFGYMDAYTPDYSIFKQEEVIPRLQMSAGCEHACSFCTIDRNVVEFPPDYIFGQVQSFKPLKFKYVYLDDKTFGQAPNYKDIEYYARVIRSYNPEFEGFVVQTTVPMLLKHYSEFLELGVVIAEIGVEVPDDAFLKKMRKPYRVHQLEELMSMHEKSGKRIKLVPNILFGVPGDTYRSTMNWLFDNYELLAWINPFILSYYEEAKAPDALADRGHSDGDDDENDYSSRSWLTEKEVKDLDRSLHYATQLFLGTPTA